MEHKLGTVVVLLDRNYESLVTELAKALPQGREGLAVVWRINKETKTDLPENLFIHNDVDRQDLIGKIQLLQFQLYKTLLLLIIFTIGAYPRCRGEIFSVHFL